MKSVLQATLSQEQLRRAAQEQVEGMPAVGGADDAGGPAAAEGGEDEGEGGESEGPAFDPVDDE